MTGRCAFWLTALAALPLAACGPSSSAQAPNAGATASPAASPRTTLTPSEQAQLAQLEARPLHLATVAAGTDCTEGPHTATITPYASGGTVTDAFFTGPVYGAGGTERPTAKYDYYFVTYFTDPTVSGVVLSRGRDLVTGKPLVFAGDYAAGPVAGTDLLDGFQVTLHTELAIPTAAKQTAQHPAAGWGVWPVTQGIDVSWTCAGIQIDTMAGTEVAIAVR